MQRRLSGIYNNDADTTYSADVLHGKRVAADDGIKSVKVTGKRPDWPESLRAASQTGNIRIYVVADGVRVTGPSDVIQVKIGLGIPLAAEGNVMTAKEFFPLLEAFIKKAPIQKVRRVSLSMCNSAGIDGEVSLAESFAKKLADLCTGLTDDITGRRGRVEVEATIYPKTYIDGKSGDHRNPLYTVMVDDVQQSVLSVIGKRSFLSPLPA
jgi:hypothetical protein